MAGLIGLLVGSTIAIYFLYAIWEFALFKRVFDDPLKGKLSSVAAAYLSGGALAGLGMADGGPFVWGAFLQYLLPAIIVAIIAYRRGLALRKKSVVDEELHETFN
jgi:hypothetical protein